jgi:hypothetical protein
MQSTTEIYAVLDAAEKAGIYHPLFSKDEFNAGLIRTFIQTHANGFWSVANVNAAIHHHRNEIHWLQDPNPAPLTTPAPSQEDVNLALAQQLAAEEDAAEQAREERRAADIQRRQGERAAQRQGKYGLGSSETVVRETGFKERRGVDSHAQKRDLSAPAATGQIQSVFVKDKLDLDTTTDADLRKATPAQILDFTKRLRAREAKK